MSWIEIPESEIIGGLNLTDLKIDEAYFSYSSDANIDIWLYKLSTNCFGCPYTRASEIINWTTGEITSIIRTTFPTKFRFRTNGNEKYISDESDRFRFCDIEYNFGEFGVYNWNAAGSMEFPNCELIVKAEPVNIYLPLILAVIFCVVFLTLCYTAGSAAIKYYENRNSPNPDKNQAAVSHSGQNVQQDEHTQMSGQVEPRSPVQQNKQRERLKSLDTFRGISIVIMIFVNDGGGSYYFFEHATWDGLYIADLVFPWFLWIMGVCIPVAIKSQMKRGTPKLKIFKSIIIRSLKLIGLGLILGSRSGPAVFGPGANLRLPGVLQRFAICYFVCATLVLVFMDIRGESNSTNSNKFRFVIQDFVIIWKSWIVVLMILLAHCLITFFLPVPGCPKGYLGPGGLHNNNSVSGHCAGGASGYLDLQIFSIDHIYQSPTSKYVYESEAYDPEGFLGSLTSIFQVWTGVQAGATMLVFPNASSRLKRWGAWAIVTGGIGALLCGAKETDGWIPVNKNLWSLSYVLVTTSFAFVLLSFLYVIIDIKKWWSGSPFLEPGMNSILLYVGHLDWNRALPWHWKIQRMETHFLKLTEALWGTSLWIFIAIWLHRKKKYWSL